MAERISVEVVDDIDGSPAAETIHFAYDGMGFEIDLSDDNAILFRSMMTGYAERARKVSGARQTAAKQRRTPGDRERSQDIRTWAEAEGIAVAHRGRISQSVEAAYEAAQRAAEPLVQVPRWY